MSNTKRKKVAGIAEWTGFGILAAVIIFDIVLNLIGSRTYFALMALVWVAWAVESWVSRRWLLLTLEIVMIVLSVFSVLVAGAG